MSLLVLCSSAFAASPSLTALQESVASLQSSVSALQGRVSTLESENTALEAENARLRADLAGLDGEFGTYVQTHELAHAELNFIDEYVEEGLENLDVQSAQMDGRIAALDGRVTTVDGQVSGLWAAVAAVQASWDERWLAVTGMIDAAVEQYAEPESLTTRVSDLEARMDDVEDTILDLLGWISGCSESDPDTDGDGTCDSDDFDDDGDNVPDCQEVELTNFATGCG